jgi:uncharacterized protein YndB with AHSA1/START domain
MKPEILEINVAIGISHDLAAVFEAIADPYHMSQYFIEKGSGRLEEGKQIIWKFPEFDIEFPIVVGKTRNPEYISWTWESGGANLLVEINLSSQAENSTLVTVTEKSMPNNEAGIKWLIGNTAGWANFLACLKAYLEYGINLRKGAFDYMSGKL